jgi:hypothetical protein
VSFGGKGVTGVNEQELRSMKGEHEVPTGDHPRDPEAKARRRLPVPADLRAFLAAVHRCLESGGRCGLSGCSREFDGDCANGEWDVDRQWLLVTYFPPAAGVEQKWELRLHPTEVEDIADGVVTELSLWCCQVPGCQSASWDQGGWCHAHDYIGAVWQDLAADPTQRVAAMKAYREAYKVGLAEAKRAVEEFAKRCSGRAEPNAAPDRGGR